MWQAGVIKAESPRQVSLRSWAIRGHGGESFAMTSYQGWDSNWMGGFSQIIGAPSPRRAFLPHRSNPQAAEDETAEDASRSEIPYAEGCGRGKKKGSGQNKTKTKKGWPG